MGNGIHTEQLSEYDGDSRAYDSQKIINDILEISLKPYLFKELLEKILAYLVSKGELRLDAKAAIFSVDHESQHLSLKACHGFSDSQKAICKLVKFGSCSCTRAATSGAIHFFSVTPPLFDTATQPDIPHGHYAVPIKKDGHTVGILALYVESNHQLSTEIEQLLTTLANILATVIESQKMDQQLIELVNDLRGSIINLREEKLFSESIIQGLNHGLIVTDLQGNILKSNSIAQSILKSFSDTIDGKNLTELLGRSKALDLTTIPRKAPHRAEREMTLAAGSEEEKILRYSIVPQEDARGSRVGVIISMTDITELKYVRREMEKMNRLSTVAEIASAVAHEVRNPLAGIKIMAQSIEEDAADHGQHLECSQRIIRQVDRLNLLLSEFFSYARPVQPNKQVCSFSSILSETMPLISAKLLKADINVVKDLAPDLPHIMADPNQMQQVFLNLILNSIDAIRQNGTITIAARLLDEKSLAGTKKKYPGVLIESPCIMVSFADNGSGMSSEVAEKVFEPFFTAKSTGTGLGLSIVYRTLRENGASITVTSEPGKGTTFMMFFQAEK